MLVLGGGLRQFRGWLLSIPSLCLLTTPPHNSSAILTEDEFYEKWRKLFRRYNYQGKVPYLVEDESDKVALIVMDLRRYAN